MKNPFPPETPEWRLFELAEWEEAEARTFDEDAERSIAKATAARLKAEAYRDALRKLSPVTH